MDNSYSPYSEEAINELIIGDDISQTHMILPPLNDRNIKNTSIESSNTSIAPTTKSPNLKKEKKQSIPSSEYNFEDKSTQTVVFEKNENKYLGFIEEEKQDSKKESTPNSEKNKEIQYLEDYISDDPIGYFYVSSITIIGLLLLYKMIRPFTK